MDFNYPQNSFHRESINIKEYYEVEYWAKKFGVKPAQLKEAVQALGPLVRDIENKLSTFAIR